MGLTFYNLLFNKGHVSNRLILSVLNFLCCSNEVIGFLQILNENKTLMNINGNNVHFHNTTDKVVKEFIQICRRLTFVNLTGCWSITDASVSELAKGCSQLSSIDLYRCNKITDASVSEISRRYPQLTIIR